MGMGFPFGSARRCGSACDDPNPPTARERRREREGRQVGDPNPARFEIIRLEVYGPFVAAEIVWPDARNYEGRKIAVYRCTAANLINAQTLDPHFQEARGPLVPIARFEPTELGWRLAGATARALEGGR